MLEQKTSCAPPRRSRASISGHNETVSPGRSLAFDILLAVERGGYASDLLAARSTALSSRDAGLASEIVFGALRFQAQLDFLMAHYSSRSPSKLDPEVRIALRMGIYQLRYVERIPPHAAVGESVGMVKRARKHSAAGFVNAVLRKINRAPLPWPDRATRLSHPEWMLARWESIYGPDAMEALALANLKKPETYVRVPPQQEGHARPTGSSADDHPAASSGSGPSLGPQLSNGTLIATDVPGCYRLTGQNTGGFRIQDIGSQAIVPLLDLSPGQRFLDLCAAPGNKTAQAAESGVRVVACDVHPRRIALLRELGVPLVVLNGTEPLPFTRRFDRILVDAPCSGTGTLARNPEIKWRLRPSDLAELHELQVRLLRNALEVLAPGGALAYSTCSLEPEENEAVVEEVLRDAACLRVTHTLRRLPGRDPGDGFYAAVLKSEQPAND
jgi:16S rRNA (cytosine967-C5)-methyltransferase